jgi:hypothetical protein
MTHAGCLTYSENSSTKGRAILKQASLPKGYTQHWPHGQAQPVFFISTLQAL